MQFQSELAFLTMTAAAVLLQAEDISKTNLPTPASGTAQPERSVIATAFNLRDTSNHPHTSGEWQGKKAVLLLFIAPECPVSNYYAPEYSRLAKAYGERGVLTYGIHCDADLTAADAAQHAQEYGLKFPILLDPEQKLTRAVGATITPEAVLISAEGQVFYRGRIDDKFALNGKRREVPTQHDLVDAIEAVLDGKSPPSAETKGFGCPIPKK